MKIKLIVSDESKKVTATIHIDSNFVNVHDDELIVENVGQFPTYSIDNEVKQNLLRNIHRSHANDRILSILINHENKVVGSMGGTENVG